MLKHLIDSSAVSGAGLCTGKKVFEISSGRYAGRIAVLMQTSPTEIKLTYADYPYSEWSTPVTAANNSDDSSFDAVMDEDNNIYLVYTLGADNSLVCLMLSFVQGLWFAGDHNVVYNADINIHPSVTLQSSARLWVAWTREASGQYYINAKDSPDGGINWGNGPSSFGHDIASGTASAFSRLDSMGSNMFIVYTVDGARLSYRKKHFNMEIWEGEKDISTGTGFDENFDTSASDDNLLGVLFDNGAVCFREFDGEKWGGIETIDSGGGEFPQLRYFSNTPTAIYLSDFIAGSRRVLYSRRSSGIFSEPAVLESAANIFDKVLCYSASHAAYQDLSSEASDDTPGDMFFAGTSVLLQLPGDTVYFGMQNRFNRLKILLSQPGTVGIVSWQYFNGQDWIGFTPSGGVYNFDDFSKDLLLWDDLLSIPADWQRCTVEGGCMFWVRIVVTSAFDIGSVGTFAGAVSNTGAIVLMEN